MLIREQMSHPVITIHPDMTLFDAPGLMRTERIRLLPVVDKRGKLVGTVTEGDLLHAGPSSATTFSVYESNQLLSKYEVKRVMTKSVITISEDTPIEEAACISISNIVSTFPGWGQNQFEMRLDL
ncbi:MAG: CBS domain-containing protein [Candidatus Promineifilaceae bacterium]